MTGEQERAIEALSLRDGGWAKATETVGDMIRVDTGHGRRYDLLSDGSTSPGGPGPWRWTNYRDLMDDVYGAGTTA